MNLCADMKPGAVMDALSEDDIIKHGFMYKRRWFCLWRCTYLVLLRNGTLLHFNDKPTSLNNPEAAFALDEATIVRKNKLFILLTANGHLKTFRCRDSVDCAAWVVALQYVMNLLFLEDLEQNDTTELCKTCSTHKTNPQEMNESNFKAVSILGQGGFGDVMLCTERKTNQPYALKIVPKVDLYNPTIRRYLWEEKRLLRDLTHPFIVKFESAFSTPDALVMVLEYLPGGELLHHLQEKNVFSEDVARFYSAEVTLALGYLHDKGVIYRDLKLENVMMARDGHVKLIDLGMCRKGIFEDDKTATVCGTMPHMAPEVFIGSGYGRSIDWWGLGVILHQMLLGENSLGLNRLFQDVNIPNTLSWKAQLILFELLRREPEARLGASKEDAREIMAHTFFQNIDWNRLLKKKMESPFVPLLAGPTDTRYFSTKYQDLPCHLPDPSAPHVPGFSTFHFAC